MLHSGVATPSAALVAVKFVAEVSSNHQRDLQRCYAFIDTALGIGCAAVKFQLFRVGELFAPEILQRSARHRARREWELPLDFIPLLAQRCRERGIEFACTPFSLAAVDELVPHVAFFKVSSYELMWDALLRACAHTGKPVVLSTGMATLDEIAHAVDVLRSGGCRDLTLLHCVSSYPAPPEQANLAAMRTLAQRFDCPIGWSDHTVSPAVIYRAAHHYNAAMVEFHLDLETNGAEYASGHCWLPDQMKAVIDAVKTGFAADGDGVKAPCPAEQPDRDWRADPSDGLRPLRAVRKDWRP